MSSSHIALYLPSLRGGGAERVMVTLANGFAERGLRVDLVLAKAEGPYLADVVPAVRVVDLGQPRVSRSLPGLVRYLRRERPMALLSALNHANVVAALAVALAGTGTRLVVSEHNSISRSMAAGGIKSHLLLRAMTWAYARADKVVAVSTGVADDLRRITKVPDDKIQTIHNPIVTDQMLEKSLEPVSGFPEGRFILAVGRLTEQKDYPTLLRAFALLDNTFQTKLVILGEGELRVELEALARDLGIADRVLMPGFVSNPYAWMRRADVFVMSSAWEGLPTVLVEAMACGAPVVSTDCPSGPAEILEGGKWGKLVPVGDYTALANACKKILSSPKINAVERAMDFAPPIAIERYSKLLIGR